MAEWEVQSGLCLEVRQYTELGGVSSSEITDPTVQKVGEV